MCFTRATMFLAQPLLGAYDPVPRLPETCQVAEIFKTSAQAGQNWHGHTSTDTWAILGGGAGVSETATFSPNAIPEAAANGRLVLGWIASSKPDGTNFVRDDGTLDMPPLQPDLRDSKAGHQWRGSGCIHYRVPASALVPRRAVFTRTSASKTVWVDYSNCNGGGLPR
jgi:hypothetical protein